MNYALHNLVSMKILSYRSSSLLLDHLKFLMFHVGQLSRDFMQWPYQNFDLDKVFEPTSEYEDSLSQPFNLDSEARLVNTFQTKLQIFF
jgi:hypothetical protein